jgi:beta-galactosidase
VTAGAPTVPTKWDGEILVPFPIESPLSGVGRLLEPKETLWYRRTFETDVK